MMGNDEEKKINLSGNLDFSISGDDVKPKKQPTPQDAIDYLDSLDIRSRNALGARDVGRTITGLHNNKVSEMEGFDVVRRDKQFYAVYKEEGRETVMIPISPAKAASTLSARRELRQTARDKLEEKQEELEYKANLKKGLRAAGFDEERAQGYARMIDGMTAKDAGEFVKSLLLAKVRASNEVAEVERVTAEYNQRMRAEAAESSRRAFTEVPEIRSLQEQVRTLSQSGTIIKPDGTIEMTMDPSRQKGVEALQGRLTDARQRERELKQLVAGLEAFTVPVRGVDNRSLIGTGFARAQSQGVSRNTVLMTPLADLAEIMNKSTDQTGKTGEEQLAMLNQFSMRMTGRFLFNDASPVEREALYEMLRESGSAAERLRRLLPQVFIMASDPATGEATMPTGQQISATGGAPKTPPPEPPVIEPTPDAVQDILDAMNPGNQ